MARAAGDHGRRGGAFLHFRTALPTRVRLPARVKHQPRPGPEVATLRNLAGATLPAFRSSAIRAVMTSHRRLSIPTQTKPIPPVAPRWDSSPAVSAKPRFESQIFENSIPLLFQSLAGSKRSSPLHPRARVESEDRERANARLRQCQIVSPANIPLGGDQGRQPAGRRTLPAFLWNSKTAQNHAKPCQILRSPTLADLGADRAHDRGTLPSCTRRATRSSSDAPTDPRALLRLDRAAPRCSADNLSSSATIPG